MHRCGLQGHTTARGRRLARRVQGARVKGARVKGTRVKGTRAHHVDLPRAAHLLDTPLELRELCRGGSLLRHRVLLGPLELRPLRRQRGGLPLEPNLALLALPLRLCAADGQRAA